MFSQPDLTHIATMTRIHTCVEVDLAGRFMLPSGQEHTCRVVEMSTGAMRFATAVEPQLGEKIIVYIAELGRFEGDVERLEEGGFAIGLKLTELKHKKLAEQLAWFANRDILELPENRRLKRLVPMSQLTNVRSSAGKECLGKINDISLVSVSVEAKLRPLLVGSRVFVGAKSAIVQRLFKGGFVADFDEPLNENELRETMKL